MSQPKAITQQRRQLLLALLVGLIGGMAVSTVLLRDCWQPQNALPKAFTAKGDKLQVRVHMRGTGSAAGTSDPAASAAAGPAVQGQSPLQHKQQQQHLVHEQNKQAVVQAAAQTSEQHNTTNQGRMHKVPQRLIVATGANGGYYHGLTNLVGSVHFWCPECPIVVFNLGLSEEQKRTVDTWCNTTLKWRDGVKIKGVDSSHTAVPQQYAWKPLAILDAVEEYKSDAVMWLDGGSTVISPLMTTIWPLLRQDGHFMVQGQDADFTRLCVQGTFDYLKHKREDFVSKPSYAGNTVGFVYGSEAYHKILLPWTQCAAVAECIAPPGSSTGNHRFDQAVLTMITYTADINVTEHTELLEGQRVPCFVPSKRAVWTSRQGESCYTKYATCAQGYQKEVP